MKVTALKATIRRQLILGVTVLAASSMFVPALDSLAQDGGRRSARSAGNNQRLDPDETLKGRPSRSANFDGSSQGRSSADGRWVRVATDYDNDGRYDATEMIYRQDLDRARATSRRRQTAGRQASGQSRGNGTVTIRGQLQDMYKIRFAGMEEPRTVARVKQQDGRTAKVLLGPSSQVRLTENAERVEIEGRRGRVNDRSMLIASRVNADGRSVQVQNRLDRPLKRVRGEVLEQRTVRFRGRDGSFVVAEVRLRGGSTQTVILGPQPRVQRLQLDPGTTVALLVRPGRINGEGGLVAEQVQANGRVVAIAEPKATPAVARKASGQRNREERAYRTRRDGAETGR